MRGVSSIPSFLLSAKFVIFISKSSGSPDHDCTQLFFEHQKYQIIKKIRKQPPAFTNITSIFLSISSRVQLDDPNY
tara:strand:+ start:201 stop:428 length:228 start_codon:yes stop_codon:yes gene_type:complete